MEERTDEYRRKLDEIIKAEEKTVFGFFIRKYRVTYLLLAALVLLGAYSLMTLPREADPEVNIPFAIVTTVFPGATPKDTEELVTNELEDRIKNLEKIRRYTSSSSAGVSSIFVEFEAEADLEESTRLLKDAVDMARPGLPGEAEDPTVTSIRTNDFPIVTYSLVGDYAPSELKRYAEEIQTVFEGIGGVSKAPIVGAIEREFRVTLEESALLSRGISPGQIIAAINAGNVNFPAGSIEVDAYNYGVRVEGRFRDHSDIADIVIATVGGNPVQVRDVAIVSDTFKEQSTISRIGFPGKQPLNTISIQVFKRTGGNILDIVDEAAVALNTLQESGGLPGDLVVQKTNDNAVFIREDIGNLGASGLQTMALIFILLAVVIGFREALITGLTVPIAFLATFIALSSQGMTLNSIVLFALVLSLGLMVDNAIVVIEGINEYMDVHGRTPYEAALLSVWNYRWPIIAGTLTTVSAFVPMLLVSGVLGEFLGYMPKTISATLLASLFVSLAILPVLASRLIKPNKQEAHEQGFVHRYIERHKGSYTRALAELLPYKKKRRILIAGAWILFMAAVALPVSGIIKIEMFPKIDIDYFVINVELPPGAVLLDTEVVTAEAEAVVNAIPELDNYVTNLGTSSSLGMTDAFAAGPSDSENRASITVNLAESRERPSFKIAESIRSELAAIQGGDVSVVELSAGPPTGAPLEARIMGPDIQELEIISEVVVRAIRDIPGTINVERSIQQATGEFTFTVDKQKANYYGTNTAAVSQAMRAAISGSRAGSITIAGEDIDIMVRYDEDSFKSADDILNLAIQTSSGETVPLKLLADVSLAPSVVSISHRDGENTVTVRASSEKGANLAAILKAFDEKRAAMDLPDGYAIEVGGEVEDIEQSFSELFYSMIVAVLLIAFILVLQFHSFRQPFIILFTLPLAVIGVMSGLALLGQAFGFPAFIGIVALSGIVVNDAIVLIDRINKNLAAGMEFYAGIVEAGSSRIQPILLTSLTTIAGIFPLLFANELWRGLSITVIFGLAFATALTLVVVPAMYAGFIRKEYERERRS